MLGFEDLLIKLTNCLVRFFLEYCCNPTHLPVIAVQKLIVKVQNYTFKFTFSE
jgi:hypothetical protein